MNTKIATGLTAVLATMALTACGGSTSAPSTGTAAPPAAGSQTSAAHNNADASFVTGMIPHHSQAVQMSALAADRASSPQVKALATTISGAQGPEIEQMQGFLRSWGLPAAPSSSGEIGGTAGMDHGGMGGNTPGMTGMMSGAQMQQLGATKGSAFDRMFLTMMTQHHTGAIQMSETELRDGENADAKALAQKIIDAQRAEIVQMRELLKTV